jgi:hypothetical protein
MLWCVVLIESSGFHLLAGKQIGRTAEAAKLVGSKKKRLLPCVLLWTYVRWHLHLCFIRRFDPHGGVCIIA